MGMYDEIRCRYPLAVPGLEEVIFQTKYTSAQNLDLYEIREDGTLWHEVYDRKTEPAEDALLGVRICRRNHRWLQVFEYNGELEIHGGPGDEYYSFRFWFRDGVVRDVIGPKQN